MHLHSQILNIGSTKIPYRQEKERTLFLKTKEFSWEVSGEGRAVWIALCGGRAAGKEEPLEGIFTYFILNDVGFCFKTFMN